MFEKEASLNPLNQVYVFNEENMDVKIKIVGNGISLNPLNQVYVFNKMKKPLEESLRLFRLNPLNQVYVFNKRQL